jgi:uncharacterized membrane protein
MADVTREARRRGKAAEDQAEEGADQARDTAQDAQQQAGDAASGGGALTLSAELKDTIREAAIEVLRPVARKATTSAAKFAVTKGPDLVKDKVAPKIVEAGGAGAIAKGVAGKGGGLASTVGSAASGLTDKIGVGKDKKGKAPTGHGRGRRLPVQESVDVGVDIQTAYDQFTQFEDWPQFMHRVEKVEQRDDTTVMFHENIWGVRRSWEAEITEQIPAERIVWRSKDKPQVIGVVTFHSLSDNLTRVQVNMDFQPQGLFEKVASGARMSRRALRSDLMRYKAFVEMRDEATGEWRGRIEDAEVVEDEGDEGREEPEGAEDQEEQPEGAEDQEEQPEASEEEEEEYEEEEEPEEEEEEEEKPRGRRGRSEEEEPEEEEEEEEPAAEEESYEDEGEAEEEEEEPEPPRKQPARRRARPASSGSRSKARTRR